LIVDDEPAIRRIAARVLQRAGFTVLDAADGEAAFKVWQQHRDQVVLVITDVMMPRRNGWELLEAIRAESPDLPFVMTSGYDASDGSAPALNHKVEVLDKPWEAHRLVATARSMIG
ncbi:MAG: response regulator, partial [Gemmatimonadota bacterium]